MPIPERTGIQYTSSNDTSNTSHSPSARLLRYTQCARGDCFRVFHTRQRHCERLVAYRPLPTRSENSNRKLPNTDQPATNDDAFGRPRASRASLTGSRTATIRTSGRSRTRPPIIGVSVFFNAFSVREEGSSINIQTHIHIERVTECIELEPRGAVFLFFVDFLFPSIPPIIIMLPSNRVGREVSVDEGRKGVGRNGLFKCAVVHCALMALVMVMGDATVDIEPELTDCSRKQGKRESERDRVREPPGKPWKGGGKRAQLLPKLKGRIKPERERANRRTKYLQSQDKIERDSPCTTSTTKLPQKKKGRQRLKKGQRTFCLLCARAFVCVRVRWNEDSLPWLTDTERQCRSLTQCALWWQLLAVRMRRQAATRHPHKKPKNVFPFPLPRVAGFFITAYFPGPRWVCVCLCAPYEVAMPDKGRTGFQRGCSSGRMAYVCVCVHSQERELVRTVAGLLWNTLEQQQRQQHRFG